MAINNPIMLVTGSRKGIGRHLAEHYATIGWNVIGCSRNPADWKADNYDHICLDVADESAVIDLFSHIRQQYGRLDVLLNNAGAASMNHSLLTPISTARNLVETNFIGTFLFCREAARLMKKNMSGRIVNFTSVAVPFDLEGEAVYAASKAAVESLTRTLARELAEYGITVNAVGPTPIETDLIQKVPPQKIRALIERQAIKKTGSMADILNVIDFFIRPESSFITAQVIYLGGVI